MKGLPAGIADALQLAVFGERALAYLQIDSDFALVSMGGDLQHYALTSLRVGEPALGQAPFLEGFLPPPETPFLLPSIEITKGRAADLHIFGQSNSIWAILLDVTEERDATRRIQQRAYDMTLAQEREALLNSRLEAANAALRATQCELEISRAALLKMNERLLSELADAAAYVRSLLPEPMAEPFLVDWRFVPSTELGGDAFGYHWLDPDHLAIYLLDVCGHGIGPSLMSIAALHVLQAASLRGVDFRDPAQVLGALNDAYPMEEHNNLYFTLWYGVYDPTARRLDYAAAGHPPALLMTEGGDEAQLLGTKNLPIGLMPDVAYRCGTATVPTGSELYVLSDGAFEVERADGSMLTLAEVGAFLRRGRAPSSSLDDLFVFLLEKKGSDTLDDDFSIIRISF